MSIGPKENDLGVTVMCKGLPYSLLAGTNLRKGRFEDVRSCLQIPVRHGHSKQPPKFNLTQCAQTMEKSVGCVGKELSWEGPLCKRARSLMWRSL